MSNRYSNSPALHLTIGKSRLRTVLYRSLCLVSAFALWLIYARGYGAFMPLLALFVIYLLSRLRRDPLVGAELRWTQGRWTLERSGVQRVIVPGRRSTATPWVICLAYSDQPTGPGGYLWLYADCAPGTQLRRLRLRLTLEC